MDIAIREYAESDKQAFLKIIEDFQDFMISIDPLKDFRRLPGYAESYLKNILDHDAKDKSMIYLAFDKKKLIAFVTGIIRTQTAEDLLGYVPTITGEITELYINPEYRGQQVGTTLLNKMEDYFKEKKCNRSWLAVYKPNTRALDFYKNNGYDECTIYLLKQFD